jgi:hypothetical protein
VAVELARVLKAERARARRARRREEDPGLLELRR